MNEQRPSGALEHFPLLHFAPFPPQSESKPHLLPEVLAQRPLLHFTPPPQSESKLQLLGMLDEDDEDEDEGEEEEDDDDDDDGEEEDGDGDDCRAAFDCA